MNKQWKPNLKRKTGRHAEAAAVGQFYTYEAFYNPAEPPERAK